MRRCNLVQQAMTSEPPETSDVDLLERAMAGAGEASTTDFLGAPNGSASGGHMGVPRLTQVRTDPNPFGLPVEGFWVYGLSVDFTAHQGPMALQRLKDQGGFNGDRIESCAMPTVFAGGSDWLRHLPSS